MIEMHKCEREACGKAFSRKQGTGKRFCSDTCKCLDKAENKRQWIELHVCENPDCGKQFETYRTKKKYCCIACKRAHEAAKFQEALDKSDKVCAYRHCANKFVGNKKQKYCSRSCAKLEKTLKDRERNAKN